MAELVEMPKMSDTMTEGVIAAWHVKVGDIIKSGQLMAEVETDKATMDLESYFDGTVLHIAAQAGSAVPVGGLIVIIGKAGEDVASLLASRGGASPAAPAPSAPPAEPVAVSAPVAVTAPAAPAPIMAPAAPAANGDSRLKASPLAKAMAAEHGLSLSGLAGTGEEGRIVKRDVEQLLRTGAPAVAASAPVASATVKTAEAYEDIAVSQMRKTIARRLSESKFTAPHFYLTVAIEMDQTAQLRKQLNEAHSLKLSFNDFVVKACALALRKHPAVNSSWLGDRLRRYHVVHVGVAVAMEEGLLVPVIRHADQKGLADISRETKDLAAKARARELQPSDWEGQTFSISNLGMYGIEAFTAIVNPPDACILAVGGINQEVIVKDGQMTIAQVMRVTLSCDHRAVDGVVGAQFLQTVKSLLENPLTMLL